MNGHVDIGSLMRTHLGLRAAERGPIRALSFRSVVLTGHRIGPELWSWDGSSGTPLTHSAFLFPTDDEGLPPAEGIRADAAAAFVPATATARWEWTAPRTAIVVWIPADALADTDLLTHGRPVGVPPTRLALAVRAFATSLLRDAAEGSEVAAYSIETLLAEMVLALLLETEGQAALQRRALDLASRARGLMRARREDPAFDVPTLAAELHVSLRQVQRAFALESSTPAAELRGLRVDLALSLLRTPAGTGAVLTVADVARHSGFHSPLHLRRALHASGLPSPRELRAAAA